MNHREHGEKLYFSLGDLGGYTHFMKSFLCFLLLFTSTLFSNTICDAEKGFLTRWEIFFSEQEFPLWKPAGTSEDLQRRFKQFEKKRWEFYFLNAKDAQEQGIEGIYRPELQTPSNYKSFGSRYRYPGSFNYNLASTQYNASIITLNGKAFIAMEAPTNENFKTFCQVLDQYQVTDLVRLTPAQGDHRENSIPYWEGHLGINLNGKTTISIAGREMNYYATDLWKDHEGIEPKSLIAIVQSVKSQESASSMIAVHCRAGIGRTGTFIAAYELMREIDQQIASGKDIDHLEISIDQIIWELSLQRPFMVTKFSQYESLYRLVSDYVRNIVLFSESRLQKGF